MTISETTTDPVDLGLDWPATRLGVENLSVSFDVDGRQR
jgi:hypothetical protein